MACNDVWIQVTDILLFDFGNGKLACPASSYVAISSESAISLIVFLIANCYQIKLSS